jgi:microcystin-dependent protein
MTLVSVLDPVAKANLGRLKYIAGDPIGGGSLSGVIIPTNHPGWVLANGATLTNTGVFVALFALLGTRFGASGQLPLLIDGRIPIPKGASAFPTAGVQGGEITHVLTLAEYPPHSHSTRDNNQGNRNNALDGYLNMDGFSNRTNTPSSLLKTSSNAGGGGAHPNMPPYQVGGFVLVKL